VPGYRADNLFARSAGAPRTRHSHVRLRVRIARRQFNGFRSDSSRPTVAFIADFQNDAITNLRLGLPYSMVIAVGDLSAGFRSWEMSYYAGDTCARARASPSAMGFATNPARRPMSQPSRRYPYGCDCNNLAPQVGSPTASGAAGVLRAGYGLQYGPILPSSYAWIRSNPPANTCS